MKRFLIVLMAIMAIFAIFGCNNGTTGGGGGGNTPGGNTPGGNTPGNTPSGDLVIDDADEIGALLAAANWGGSLDHVTATNNVAHFNIPASGSTDNNGFKLSFPEAAVGAGYLELQVSFKVVEVTTLEAGKNAKIGFKSGSGGPDVTPYDDFELVFGTIDSALDEELTQAFSLYQPNKLPGNALWFSHNAYGDGAKAGSAKPVNYKLEITKLVFVGGEAEACCDDCEPDCIECNSGDCVNDCGEGGTCCLPPAAGTFTITNFTDTDRTGGYGYVYVSGNEWKLPNNYQQVKFSIGETVTGENFESVTVVYTTDLTATVSFYMGSTQDTAIAGGYQGKIDLASGGSPKTVNLNADTTMDGIAFESKNGGEVTITITSVTFNARN